MAGFGPFEAAPHVAAAVSGGADSLALGLLARDWAAARGGRLTALTVDHGLRPDSAEDAGQVASWLRRLGIEHHVLRWQGPKPAAGIQAAARAARYRLLCGWCREAGVLHLLLGHHRRDQAETVLHRALHGSGLAGLAGMADRVETADVRLLRPLLTADPAALRAWLVERGQPWLEDPANRDPQFARTRLRRILVTCEDPDGGTPSLHPDGGTPSLEPAALQLAAAAARARAAMTDAVAALAGRACRLHPAGFALIDRAALAAASPEAAVETLARITGVVGGRAYGCSAERLRAVFARLVPAGADTAATLAGCRLIGRGGQLLVCREQRNLPPPRPLAANEDLLWDGRFRVVSRPGRIDRKPLWLRAAAAADLRRLKTECTGLSAGLLPDPVRATLPAFYDCSGLAFVPHLGYLRSDFPRHRAEFVRVRWIPGNGITGPGYFLATAN
jgi:tRNA(Ile)-lysidine synthase